MLAKLVITGLCSQFGQRLLNIGQFHLTPVGCCRHGRHTSRREPEGGGIEFEQARRLRRRVAKLEAEFDGVELG